MKKAASIAVFAAALLIAISIQSGNTYASSSVNATTVNSEKALDLKILGLFNGTNEGFELNRVPSRVEGAVMLLRLLGEADDAEASNYSHPFSDVPTWADKYIGYMYAKGLTSGLTPELFGSDQAISSKQYVTFVLRALGYDDKKNDFTYEGSIDTAVGIKLLTAQEAQSMKSGKTFLRDDLVGVSYEALETGLHNSGKTLIDKLANDDKTVFKPAATALGILTSDLEAEYGNIESYAPASSSNGYVVKNNTELFKLLRKSVYTFQSQVRIDLSSYSGDLFSDFESTCDRAVSAVTKSTGVENILSEWAYSSTGNSFTLSLSYWDSKKEFDAKKLQNAQALYKARYIVAARIKPSMSDYNKELVLHDYIVNTTKYDYENYKKGSVPDVSFTAYGCLNLGTAVCQGYSNAMKLLSDLSGLECLVVAGKSSSGSTWEGHAWNMVKVAGNYYHLDVTFDDPVVADSKGLLTHYYFNLSDKELSRKHRWDASAYPDCNSTAENFYTKNGMVAANISELNTALLSAVQNRKTEVEIRVSNYSEAAYDGFTDVLYRNSAVEGFYYVVNDEFGVIRLFDIRYS